LNAETPLPSSTLTTAQLATAESRATATPMMEQFIEIKAANPDSLLFYRMGDFYELFFEDAIDASRALGITLTKRGQHLGQDIPMCGVPVHAADDYLQKLISLGFRVAVCEQTEDPAEAKKRGSKSVVRRDVTRLVTPGTLDRGQTARSLAVKFPDGPGADQGIGRSPVRAGLDRHLNRRVPCGRKPAGGSWPISPGSSRANLILAENVFHDPEIRPLVDQLGRVATPQPGVLFDSATAEGRIKRFYDLGSLDGFGSFSRAELAAAAAVIAYVEKTQISERPPLGRPQRESDGALMFIDPATRASLELVRTLSGARQGSLIKAIDRTVTAGGGRKLGEWLMAPLTDPGAINARLDGVSCLIGESALTDALRQALKGVADMPRALSRLALNRGGPRDLGAILAGVRAAGEIAALFDSAEVPEHLAAAASCLRDLPEDIAARLSATLDDELPLLKRDGGFVRAGASGELDELRALRDQSRRVIAGLQLSYAEETGVRSLKIKHNNVLGYFIEVTALNAGPLTQGDEAKARFIHRQTMANAMRFTTTELSDLETRIASAAGEALAIELAAFEELVLLVVSHAETIKAAADALSVIDVTAALAELAQEQGYCRPKVDASLAFEITAGRHPVVEQALRRQAEQPFVANDCALSPPEGSPEGGAIWLLTGPNMGGKSTFLRQNALIAVMAQMGSFVPAGAAHIGVVDRLFSRVGASDDLARGARPSWSRWWKPPRSSIRPVRIRWSYSTRSGAARRPSTGCPSPGRRSNICMRKTAAGRCSPPISTNLTALSEKLPRLSNATMKVKEWQGEVVFLHEVGPGAADRSYGIQVARLAGLPDAVVVRAREVLDLLESSERENPAARLVDDLPLFAMPAAREPARPARGPSGSDAYLSELNPDDMTPREALEALYELKRRLDPSGKT
jgi:DNA mismatch repair protein MutS